MLRFHLDEMVPSAVAAGMRSSPDLDQLEFADHEGRVLMTHDPDFLRIHASGREHAGLAYRRQTSRTVGELIAALALLDECLMPEEMRNRVEFL